LPIYIRVKIEKVPTCKRRHTMLNFCSKLGLALMTVGIVTSIGISNGNAITATFMGKTCDEVKTGIYDACHGVEGSTEDACVAAREVITNRGCLDQ